ncbi:hypothetical protein AGMMS49992_16860 [Clostridia bacterium]|nr:hypothetical protein AGMMS49992_16860 [Clostridia bacterium]
MANTIAHSTQWVDMFDEAYRLSSLTAILDSPPDLVNWLAGSYQLEIPRITLPVLANYSRSDGYVTGDVNVATQIVAPTYERGRMFSVDKLDVDEAIKWFGNATGQFIRQIYVPELDGWRISKYASAAGIGTATGALTTGANIVAALRAAVTAMDNAECPDTDRVLYILPGLMGIVEDMDTTQSRAVLARFSTIVRMPPSRMYATYTLTAAGGSVKADPLNFLAIAKGAAIQVQKHVAPKIIEPDANQRADAWSFGFRSTGYTDVFLNKVSCVYSHEQA